MPDDMLQSAVHKWLNGLRYRLRCELGWAEGSMCYMGPHLHNRENSDVKNEFFHNGLLLSRTGFLQVIERLLCSMY